MTPTLKDLALFIHLADAQHLGKGAERAALSASAASIRLKALEETLDSSLFRRHAKGLTLTPAGEVLYQHARQVMSSVESLKREFSQPDHETGKLCIYANTTAVIDILPDILSSFMVAHPKVSIDLQEKDQRYIVQGVEDGKVDFGIVSGEISAPALSVIPFSRDHLCVVYSSHHHFLHKGNINYRDTFHYPHLGLSADTTLQRFLRKQQELLGVELHQRIELSGFESLCRMIEAGVGIGVVPESTVRRYAQMMDIQFLRIKDPWAVRVRSIIVSNYHAQTPLCRMLIDAIKQQG
ncbi:LysR family transcriptional regulator [Cardiobacteriaceae bacterium TAE3-ERU3]|nr:LysR family transcriptional regulator [Cardiobacteriaceae bacterium TAE3-ERU3]